MGYLREQFAHCKEVKYIETKNLILVSILGSILFLIKRFYLMYINTVLDRFDDVFNNMQKGDKRVCPEIPCKYFDDTGYVNHYISNNTISLITLYRKKDNMFDELRQLSVDGNEVTLFRIEKSNIR